MIDHTRLSKFRSCLSFVQQINLLVYTLHYFYKSGLLGDCVVHGIDSTELANDCKVPLASPDINGKKIRIYNDIDCDCGTRHNKQDKSIYVIGYRLHTLTVIDAKTGHSFPLVSLLAPANHHDSHFLPFLVKLAQAMGIDIKLITADEAYHDKDGSLFGDTGVLLTTPPQAKVLVPENFDRESGAVFWMEHAISPCSMWLAKPGATNIDVVQQLENAIDPASVPNVVLFKSTAGFSSRFPMEPSLYNRPMRSEKTANVPSIS